METPQARGGSCCAVATCTNYSGKAKKTGRTDLSFYRYDIIFHLYNLN